MDSFMGLLSFSEEKRTHRTSIVGSILEWNHHGGMAGFLMGV